MKKMKIFILAAALAACGLMTLAACETPDDTVHTHSFGEWEVVTEPTCTEEGKLERTCSCGEKETSSISALGHGKEMTVRENEVAATCTESGSYEDVVYCTVCEEEMSRKTVKTAALGHTAGETVKENEVAATCTEQGSYEDVVYCTVCEEEMSRKTVEIPAAGHKPGAAATCINAQVCSVCGTVLAPMLAHTPGEPVRVEEIPATCTEGGSYEEVISCTVCGGELSRKIVETLALGHDYVNGVCTRCHDVLVTEGLKFQLSADGKSYVVSDYVGYSTEVYIPSVYEGLPVTAIGDRAFEGSERMMHIVLPDTITSIGSAAFEQCPYLEEIRIPDSVTTIGSSAFSGCRRLTSVSLGDGVTSIGEWAFSGCDNLTSITLPDSVTSIESSAFANCSSLTNITIPDSVTSIGYYAFGGCGSLTSIVIPDSVTSVGSFAFKDTPYYNEASNWENGVLYIGNHLVEARDSISGNYSVRVGTKTIAGEAFACCSRLTSVVIPDSVTEIGGGAFADCSRLTGITIPDGVTSIGEYAFADCSNLTSIVIPDSVTEIDWGSFSGCSSLTSITLPDSVTIIGEYAFAGCSSLTSIVIPDSVTTIGYGAFAYCSRLTGITIPDGVTSIGYDTFAYCSRLTSVVIPDSVTEIGGGAFADCSRLTSIVIPDGVTSIGYNTFANCSRLTNVVIPDSVTEIGDGAFSGCNSLTSIVIPDSVTFINDSAFYGCSSLTSVVIPDGVTSIGYNTFADCSSLTSIVIPDSVIFIGEGAFSGCSELMIYTGFLEQPDGWIYGWNGDATVAWAWDGEAVIYHFESDGGSAIEDITSAMAIVLPVPQREGYLFAGWYDNEELSGTALQSPYYHQGGATLYARWMYLESLEPSVGLEIEDGYIVGIGSCTDTILILNMPVAEGAFIGCHTITKVFFGPGVTSIGDRAFFSCGQLTEVVFLTAVPPEIGSDVFGSTWDRADFTVYVPEGSLAAYEAVDDTLWQSCLVDAGKIEEM